MSSRIRFRELSRKREDECYKEIHNFLKNSSIKKRILISHILKEN